MATCVITRINDDMIRFQWTLTSADAIGDPVGPEYSNFADRTVQFTGTAGTSSVWTVEGSNDGTNYGPMNDAFGGDLNAITINALNSIAEVPLYTRPKLGTAGSGASLVVTIVGRRNRPGLTRG